MRGLPLSNGSPQSVFHQGNHSNYDPPPRSEVIQSELMHPSSLFFDQQIRLPTISSTGLIILRYNDLKITGSRNGDAHVILMLQYWLFDLSNKAIGV